MIYDIAIIGGGINGCGIARDAAGRNLKVFLCDKGDLGGATSSSSTKLIHGGLRYLETYEFSLVKKALKEREVLLNTAPHIIKPIKFILPHTLHLRPKWLIRFGLFIYDYLHISSKLSKSYGVNFANHTSGKVLKEKFKHGFCYSDCTVDDSRLVILNAIDAKEKGAHILSHTECIKAEVTNGIWLLKFNNTPAIKAKIVINATGPWAGHIFKSITGKAGNKLRLVKGSHIVVPKLFNHNYSYIFQHIDSRVIFVIPYQNNFTLIGTTEEDFTSNPQEATCSKNESEYLCSVINSYFKKQISPKDIVWSYAGVRAITDGNKNTTKASRDYKLELIKTCGAPLLNIWGGKITTYRALAEHALNKLTSHIKIGKNWTKTTPLPGGINIQAKDLQKEYPWLDKDLAQRYASSYGSLAYDIIGKISSLTDMGEHFGHGLYKKEVNYLMACEWATSSDDILWRRTKLGLYFTASEQKKLDLYIKSSSYSSFNLK